MQQFLVTVPDSREAKNLLNYIIKTGFFKNVQPIDAINDFLNLSTFNFTDINEEVIISEIKNVREKS